MNEVSVLGWAMAYTAIFLLGISKSGLKGLSIFNVTLLALAFGAKESTGILMPLLLVGDIFAVIYYNRHARWDYLWKFLPWMILGILIGVIVGKDLPEKQFKIGMALVILLSLVILVWWENRKSKKVPQHWTFAGSVGIVAGICTMIGNLAGAFTNLFFLAIRLPKNEFVGTAAWLFFMTNFFKLPFHIFVWKTITPETLAINLKLLPAIIIGLALGIRIVKRINEKHYRRFILVVTAIGALIILFK
ncbi:sulfite exporter TauE/SafE family protein [Allomuricauda sp. SCSIO 65647]|uniref:sulfite exporter TauE/SafE family protein n=1 Tax=Allomuricauda sp. SCSIO 65647 TaxID=2908843 RepID=UPI001F2BCE16|nr:sulfite exporter TauE/SafE family protein [Muricauda sp. SCSIO 65647]UJH69174.1 sulfite exporter TauE/SafE family protein [Muricauda sp. SCSIO 65647]